MNKLYKKLIFTLPAIVLVFVFACKPAADRYTSPAGYNFNEAEKFNMPESLLEISGIAFYKGDGTKLYAVQDEDGKLFKQTWGVKKQVNVKFNGKGDYEDVAMFNEQVFVLKSSGTVYGFKLNDMQKQDLEQVKEWKGILPKGEYESLYADQHSNLLYVLCKECKTDKKTEDVSGYILKYDERAEALSLSGKFKVHAAMLETLGKPIKSALKPSALSRNPKTNEWYILSSVNKMLIVASANWEIKEAHRLSPSKFNQPEGIAFDTQNNLYISNEGDEMTSGNVLKFLYSASN